MWPNHHLPRRRAYSLIVIGSTAAVLSQFLFVTTIGQLLLTAPLFGFFGIGGFGFFAVYFPELFPTAIRATGQGFCWNLARSITLLGPFVAGTLVGVLGSIPAAGRVVASMFLIGLIAIWSGPETRGQPLQD
jgi:MFS family permease